MSSGSKFGFSSDKRRWSPRRIVVSAFTWGWFLSLVAAGLMVLLGMETYASAVFVLGLLVLLLGNRLRDRKSPAWWLCAAGMAMGAALVIYCVDSYLQRTHMTFRLFVLGYPESLPWPIEVAGILLGVAIGFVASLRRMQE